MNAHTQAAARPTSPGMRGVLSLENWHEMRDAIVLALDILESDLDLAGLLRCVMYQRDALKVAHRRLEAIRRL